MGISKIIERFPSELQYVRYYQAPDRDINPKTIASGTILMEILTGGGVFFLFNGERRLFKRGTVFIHSPGHTTIYDRWSEDPYRCIVLGFAYTRVETPLFPRVNYWNDQDYLDNFAAEAMAAYHDDSTDLDILGQWIFSTVLWQVSASSKRFVPEYPPAVERALKRIDRDPGRVASVQQLATKCGISVPYFQNLFKAHLGVTPHHFLMVEKLKKARALLAGTDDSIKNIAENCGFKNIETFYRVFSRQSKMTPGEFRKRNSPLYRIED